MFLYRTAQAAHTGISVVVSLGKTFRNIYIHEVMGMRFWQFLE